MRTTLVNVLLGTLLGGWVVVMAQGGQKTREFQFVAYKEYLDQQRDVALQMSELIGHCVTAADDLILLTGPDFDLERYPGLEGQRLAMRKNYNHYRARWGAESGKLGYAMSYYHQGQPAVVGSWQALQDATSGYMDCAQQWYLAHNTAPVEIGGVCRAEKGEVTRQLAALNTALNEARSYVWQGVEPRPGR